MVRRVESVLRSRASPVDEWARPDRVVVMPLPLADRNRNRNRKVDVEALARRLADDHSA